MTAKPSVDPQLSMGAFMALYMLSTRYGSTADASSLMSAIAHFTPENPELEAARARLLISQGQVLEARAMLERQIELHPEHPVVQVMLALCLYAQGDPLWQSAADRVATLPHNDVAQGVLDALSERTGVRFQSRAAPAQEDARTADFIPMNAGLSC